MAFFKNLSPSTGSEGRWITYKGRRIFISSKKPPKIKSATFNNKNKDGISTRQLLNEEKHRRSPKEHLEFIGEDGKVYISTEGTDESVGVSYGDVFSVMRELLNGKKVHTTHNHNEAVIFSPEDIGNIDIIEPTSSSVTYPDGTTVRLIRDNPPDYTFNSKGRPVLNNQHRMAPDYAEAFFKARREYMDASISEHKTGKKSAITSVPIDTHITNRMTDWLSNNASKYNMRFEKTVKSVNKK